MKYPITRKALLVAIALLFLGQNLFAGGKWHLPPNALDQGAKLATSLVILLFLQQLGGNEDGDNESAAETTEYTHAGEESQEKAEELDESYAFEREAARCIDNAFSHLPPEERAMLVARTCEPFQEAFERKHRMGQRVHEIIQRAASGLCPINRGVAAREIGEILASPEMTLTDVQRDMLLYKLIGEHGDQGLASDEHWSVRWPVAKAIGLILASGNLDADVRAILLTRLVGGNTQTGLINDEDENIREETIKAIGTILATEHISEDERPRLLNMLVGEKEHEGLASNKNPKMRRGVAQAIGDILASKQPGEGERLRLIHALEKLASDVSVDVRWDVIGVRWHVVEAIGNIFVSSTPTEDERSKLIGMLIGEDNQEGLASDENESVRWNVAMVAPGILASSSLSNNEFLKIRRALTVLSSDQYSHVRDAARMALQPTP